jgi:hypothetical protein
MISSVGTTSSIDRRRLGSPNQQASHSSHSSVSIPPGLKGRSFFSRMLNIIAMSGFRWANGTSPVRNSYNQRVSKVK